MNLATKSVSAGAIGLLLVAANAYAQDEEASPVGCSHMAEHVRAAMRTNEQSANHDVANVERRQGAEECRQGYYKLGIEHYAKALELLGAS